jgi:acetyl coenzyme A synthetase (ADP forming)-like protein
MPAPLDAIFRPRSVAVVGASRQPASIGREIISNLMDCEFTGKVFPVNPKAAVIHSMKCYPSVTAIPDRVDLAVIVVPRERVLQAVAQCARKRVRGLFVITAGFRESGPAGARIEKSLLKIVRKAGMRMVGPNCMGVINTDPGIALNASFAAVRPERGGAAFVSQSGALGEAILANARDLGLGISMFVSMGNRTDVSGNDLLEYWEDDPAVRVILMYLESFGNPRRFTEIARRITRKKPILTVKSGRTEAGARAAVSHTGSLAATDDASDSLLQQCGVLRVATMEEMFSIAPAFTQQPVPAGPRVGIVTNAGGPGILATDAAVSLGLTLPEFSPATQRALKKVLPPEATLANPVDLIASATPERYEAALRAVCRDPGVDAVIAIFVSPITVDASAMARAIARAAKDCPRPVLVVFMSKAASAEGTRLLRANGLPVYLYPEEAATALAAMNRYRQMRDRPTGKFPRFRVDTRGARSILAAARRRGRTLLTREETDGLLKAYGFRLAPSRIVRSAAEAVEFAAATGYPSVLKAVSGSIVHKTDVGGVKTGLRDARDVQRAWKELRALRAQAPDLRILAQKMVPGGRELILGMTTDPQFGPVVLFGLGGIYVEVMRDVALRVHPLTDAGARQMIRSVRAWPLLEGVRGEAPAAVGAIEEALLRLSQMITEQDALRELDINPFIVNARAEDCYVVDARVRIAAAGERARAKGAE